jgi:hypothetical protein
MNTTDISGALVDCSDHSRDGDDPDRPIRRIGGSDWKWCESAVQDLRELEAMSESDLRHYCATPGGSRCNSISRGR